MAIRVTDEDADAWKVPGGSFASALDGGPTYRIRKGTIELAARASARYQSAGMRPTPSSSPGRAIRPTDLDSRSSESTSNPLA
jgi:hypothetical protein